MSRLAPLGRSLALEVWTHSDKNEGGMMTTLSVSLSLSIISTPILFLLRSRSQARNLIRSERAPIRGRFDLIKFKRPLLSITPLRSRFTDSISDVE